MATNIARAKHFLLLVVWTTLPAPARRAATRFYMVKVRPSRTYFQPAVGARRVK